MRYTIIILVALLSGCETVGSLVKPQKSADDRFAERVKQWSDSKIQTMLADFDSGLPLVSGDKITFIPLDKAPEVYKKTDLELLRLRSDLAINEKNMGELKSIHSVSRATSSDLDMTRSWFESELSKYSNDFHETVVQQSTSGRMSFDGSAYTTENLLSYCESHGIQQGHCKSEPYNRNGNAIAVIILSKSFMRNHPDYRDYFEWVSREKESFDKIAGDAEKLGIEYESEMFLKKASSSGCKNISRINFIDNLLLAAQVSSSNFRPEKTSVYDLGYFKVLQTQTDGVLLSTTYPGSHNVPLVYAYTQKEYTDGYTFQPREQLACVAGVKEYVSIIGVKKRVISFRTINDNNKYYFFLKTQE